MAEQKEVYPIDTFLVTMGGVEAAGLFNTVSGISSAIDPTGFDHVDANGKPQVAKTPAKVQWGDVTCSRGMDKDNELWQWHFDCIEKGIGPEGITVELLDTKGTTVLTGASRTRGRRATRPRGRTPPAAWSPPSRSVHLRAPGAQVGGE